MKKKMIALLAGAMMFAAMAGNAFAYFDDYNLVRIVYNNSTKNETATDLGNINDLLGQVGTAGSAGITVGGGTDAFTTYAGMTASQDANLMVAYMVSNSMSDSQIWLSAPVGASVPAINAQLSNMQNGMLYAYLFGYAANGTSTATASTTDGNSYYQRFSAANPGTFAGFLATNGQGEASLSTLANASVQQGLYYWADGNTGSGTALNLTILTNADGTTTLKTTNAPTVPIPPAFFLMGSGLLGMIGLRRRARG